MTRSAAAYEKQLARNKEYRAKHADRIREYNRQRYRSNPETMERYRLKTLYKITPEERDALYAAQGGCCAICRVSIAIKDKSTHIDHDHVTGEVRGILCRFCNVGLGKFKDDAELLMAAAEYLKKHAQS